MWDPMKGQFRGLVRGVEGLGMRGRGAWHGWVLKGFEGSLLRMPQEFYWESTKSSELSGGDGGD